ncbi:MAG: hypothetical protein AVDCRST_MAG64-2714, partial [uncultured Phycisphaerae bacterium]
ARAGAARARRRRRGARSRPPLRRPARVPRVRPRPPRADGGVLRADRVRPAVLHRLAVGAVPGAARGRRLRPRPAAARQLPRAAVCLAAARLRAVRRRADRLPAGLPHGARRRAQPHRLLRQPRGGRARPAGRCHRAL